MNGTPLILKNKIIFKKFKLGKLLNASPFGWVYEGKNVIKDIPVAIKIEKTGKYDFLQSEVYILMSLKGFGIPEVITFGKHGPFKILIEELLGKDIDFLWKSYPYKKDPFGKNNTFLNDICLLAIQGIERLQYIHSKYVIHRDIKPQNFIIGLDNPNDIYLIDFGFAKKYRSSRTGKHIRFSKTNFLIGSFAFASLNSVKGYEISRRDDLESFGYMLIYLAKGGVTPWSHNQYLEDRNEAIKNIMKMKLEITDESLCKGLPNEFIHYLKYVKKLDFEQEPDYQYLKGLFTSILSKNETTKNLTFFWIKQNTQKKRKQVFEIRKNLKSVSLSGVEIRNSSRSNSLKRLYNKIKTSLSLKTRQKNNSDLSNNGNNTTNINNKSMKKNLVNLTYNNKGINSNIKSPKIARNNAYHIKSVTNISLTSPAKQIKFKKLFQTSNTKKNKINIKTNLISNNDKALLQKIKLIKEKINNYINLKNSTFHNPDFSMYNNFNYNNIYFIKGNNGCKNNNCIINNSKLNIINNKKSFIYSHQNINDLNLKRNIVYKPKFSIDLV